MGTIEEGGRISGDEANRGPGTTERRPREALTPGPAPVAGRQAPGLGPEGRRPAGEGRPWGGWAIWLGGRKKAKCEKWHMAND